MKPTCFCKIDGFNINALKRISANITLLENHPKKRSKKGEKITTSSVQTIDFIAGVMVTFNTIYLFEGEETPFDL